MAKSRFLARWKVLTAVSAIALIALTPIGFASGEPPPDAGPTLDEGTITLHLNTDGNYFRYSKNGSVLGTQLVRSNSKCQYQAPTAATLLFGLSSTASVNNSVGFQAKPGGYGLGVNTNDGGTKCSQVNAYNSERLTFDLANGAGQNLDGKYLDYAMLDVEAKYNAGLNIQLFKDGVSVWTTPAGGLNCTGGSDCGPDSGGGDNFRVRVPTAGTILFDSMKVWATGSNSNSAVTVEGGNDSGTLESVFHVVSPATGVLNCGQLAANPPAGVTLLRLANADPDEPCVLIPYILTRDGNSVEFLKDLLSQQSAQFRVAVNAWDPEPAALPLPVTQVDTPAPGHDIQWCGGDETTPTLPNPNPTGEVTCLIRQDAVVVSDGFVQVSDLYYLKGDMKWSRS